MSEVEEPPQLTYAPGAPVRRRRVLRRAAALCLAVALAFTMWRWGRELWTRTALLYHQRQCLRHTARPDEVVFDSDPARVALLASDPHFVIAGGCAFRTPTADWLAVRPAAAVWRTTPVATVFLHELKVGGVTRLVEVERFAGSRESIYFIAGYDVDTHPLTPATFKQPQLVDHPIAVAFSVLDGGGPHRDLRVFAGQFDPADPSHFTIRCEQRGETHTAHGYLRASGDVQISLEPDR